MDPAVAKLAPCVKLDPTESRYALKYGSPKLPAIKSITRRPSQYRPAGARKYVSPWGGGACPNAADKPPVSEFESPKLNTAGNSQWVVVVLPNTELETKIDENKTTRVSMRRLGQLDSMRELLNLDRKSVV